MPVELWKRAVLIPLLLFSLYLLTDNDTNASQRHHHLAVLTALQRHPPSMRVFRSLLELNLLLWGALGSFWLWSNTLGQRMLGYLLFQPAEGAEEKLWMSNSNGSDDSSSVDAYYLPVQADEMRLDESLESSSPGGGVEESKMYDAHYESDGEVPEPPVLLLDFPAPSPSRVAGLAVDSLVLILISLFLFTFSSAEGGTYVDGMVNVGFLKSIALVAAPLFPLLLFLGVCLAAVFPWRKRWQFWKIVSFTIGAPCYHVTFRDGFIGDIFTSMVRPLQDTAFTLFYLVSGLQGWWKQSYNLDQADLPLETNWLLHTCILPMCMLSPLWWRFCQNIRQCYETRQRWPYLGNALKYMVAAEVAMFGLFDPSRQKSVLWLGCFVLATLYQIWWDVVMDWNLVEFQRETNTLKLRSTRIYSVKWMYWSIFGVNIILRFCWTLSFLPPHYLNKAGVLSETFEGDLTHILNPIIASAEIVRRTLWGFLRVEWEAIKVARNEPRLKGVWSDDSSGASENEELEGGAVELKAMKLHGADMDTPMPMSHAGSSLRAGWSAMCDMSDMSEFQVLSELCIYAIVFTGLGMLAAAHRVTL